MSRIEKLVAELAKQPKDFTYSDLRRVLVHFGFEEDTGGKTSGSRIKFIHPGYPPIVLHKPHPSDRIKTYAIRDIIARLKEDGLL